MGLSLCYEFRLEGNAETARRCLWQLHEFARTLEFAEVQDIIEWGAPDVPVNEQEELSAEHVRLLKVFGSQYGQKTMRDGAEVWIDIAPKHILVFGIHPAEGSETAQFGFASHPAVVEHVYKNETLLIETGLTGVYSWAQCCKTQYAGLQQNGGVSNFLFAHLGLIRCLDFLGSLGVDVEVKDDSGFWDDRDETKLRKSLEEWNGLVAAFAGQMKDRLGQDSEHGISAPILTAPDFEHMEAKGLTAWSDTKKDEEPPAN